MTATLATETTTGNATIDAAVARVQQIEKHMNVEMVGRDDVIRATLCAVLACEHVVLLGPPGTGKSMLVDLLAEAVASATGGGLRKFDVLMTKFTTPDELFGPVSVAGLKRDEYRRIITGMLPDAEFAFLDEVFKASSAVLNSLLKLMNERTYRNGTTEVKCPLMTLVGASNEMPDGDESGAAWDRFMVRVEVGYASDSDFGRLLRLSALPTAPATITQADLTALQAHVATVAVGETVLGVIMQLRRNLAAQGVVVSDRRWRKALRLLQAHAVIEGRTAVDEDDLQILKHILWQRSDQRVAVGQEIAKLASPLNARALELADVAQSVYDAAIVTWQDGTLSAEAKMSGVTGGLTKLREIREELKGLYNTAKADGRNTARIIAAGTKRTELAADLARIVQGE